MARALVAGGRLPAAVAERGSALRYHPVGDQPQSPPPAARALGATAARRRGPPRAPHAGRVARTLLGTGAAPPAAVSRGSPRAPRSARQPASPLGTPPLQHLPAAFRRHTLTEPVRLGAPATVRLERPLHLRPPSARPAHSPLILQTGRGPRQAVRRYIVAELRLPPQRSPCYGGPLGSETGRAHAATPCVHRDPKSRAANPVRQVTTAGLPELSTAVDKCVRNLPA